MKYVFFINSLFLFVFTLSTGWAQSDTTVHELIIKKEKVNKSGKEIMAMTVNGSIPGPTLEFKEGDFAVIYVKNEMDVETSIHWHGLLLPNFYDGVPYLNTPPIEPGHTQKYEFRIKQSGTYWYHSHTMLQEQKGVYGSIVIQPKNKIHTYDKELVLMLSDWTNENPMSVLKNLKRRNEWYNIKKGTATPLNRVIAQGALGAQFNFWRQRMEGADIADVYYPAFLINGKTEYVNTNFIPGEKVRLRFINGAASSYFWLTFGGEDPLLISADGIDVEPVSRNKTLIAIAETYDFIVSIPENGKLEIHATSQDGSGVSTAYLGKGEIIKAPVIERPNKIKMMQEISKMKMKMGAPALKMNPKKDDPYKLKEKYGMKMSHAKMAENSMNKMPMLSDSMTSGNHQMDGHNMEGMKMNHSNIEESSMPILSDSMTTGKHQMEGHKMGGMKINSENMDNPSNTKMPVQEVMANRNEMDLPGHKEGNMEMKSMEKKGLYAEYNYDYLKSRAETNFDKNLPVKEILLNLTGNMNRYIWSLNGLALAETDMIKINSGEVTRITLNNLTMMHHPMHLHGHFFRVINKNGTYSPLKHTVNVPPMQEITIEFFGDETGDWFFHCHVLYHMMGGMARVMSYGTPRDERMTNFPLKKIIEETDMYYTYGLADIASHMTAVNLVSSNIRNQFNFNVEYGYNKNLESEFSYQRYLYDYLSVFGGINLENKKSNSLDEMNVTFIAGIRYLSPYLFNIDFRLNHNLNPRFSLSRSIMIFPRLSVFGYYEYQANLNLISTSELIKTGNKDVTWNTGLEYMFSKNFSLMASYDNRFGSGGGLSIRF